MHENQILDFINAFSVNQISDDEKAIIVADVNFELSNKRFASSLPTLVMSKINDLAQGMYKESQYLYPQGFGDFNETESYPKGSDVINKSEIDKFLEKMSSDTFEGNYFDDTFDTYHPERNMRADGVARFRADFNVQL